MKHPLNDDNSQRLRDKLRLQIDNAAKAVAEVLHTTCDLFIPIAWQPPTAGSTPVETKSIPETMAPGQAAEYLGVTVQTLGVWRCTRRYPLPFVKVGSKVRYRKADLDKFIERRTEGSDDES
jgi:excisionase family DNA binding protein